MAVMALLAPALAFVCGEAAFSGQASRSGPRRNAIIFVADGLRHDSVNAVDTPSLWAIRTEGVHFSDSYSVFPTFTTPNAAAIATGHGVGDTGDYSNNLWIGAQTFATGLFGHRPGSPIAALENDEVIADLDGRFHGNYLGEPTLLAMAKAHGYNTAVIGKTGPAAIQHVEAIAPVAAHFPAMDSDVIVDDTTGAAAGIPLPPPLVARLRQERLALEAPSRSNGYGATSPYNNGFVADATHPGTVMANVVQQQWFTDVATRAVLPMFADDGDKPFVVVFWSRDPDASQHGQGDSPGTLTPGINGPTSRAGVENADRTLGRLLAWLDQHPAVKANTDVVVTSDHGFATVSHKELDASGRPTTSEAARHAFRDANRRVVPANGLLPHGFLAMDLAAALTWNLFDTGHVTAAGVREPPRKLELDADVWERPIGGSAFLGGDVVAPDGADAKAIVVADGVDSIYVPNGSAETVRTIAAALAKLDYVGGIFVDDKFAPIAGALPMSAVGMVGPSAAPRPALVVAFKVFYLDPKDLRTGVMVVDSSYLEGQGMHGGLGRECTFNNMAAIGPDFKKGFSDVAPVGNVDIAPTLAHLLGFDVQTSGALSGRVLLEALTGGPTVATAPIKQARSSSANGLTTLLEYREFAGKRYVEDGCFVAETATSCR